ncbi:hypothetical protein [Streptomyces sp. NBC_01465]|uniref:hypothetical protein n=1 Tax=Streptomyces sp. NBC_01465 TaxID=2903878 RepID=UPI002E2F4AB8|nr:hypothetical protein [Streptomyces sp. NBC_01465]
MKVLRRLADSALERVVPSVTAEAVTYTYKCTRNTCPYGSGTNVWHNVRYKDGVVDPSYKSCCVQAP